MKVLLLGGTGAIGENLVEILYKNSIETFVTSRSERKNRSHITYIKGNAHDMFFLKELCTEEWDAVVDFMSYKTDEFEDRIDLLLSCTKQYIFISSARVYANDEHPIKESSPRLLDVCKDSFYLSSDEYALTKARQEDIIYKHSTQNNYTIVRPYITYSQTRLQLGVLEKEEWLFRALQGHTIVLPETMCDKITTMTSGYDVANGIYNIIDNENAFGESIHITSEALRTWGEILNIYSNVFLKETGTVLKVKTVDLDTFFSCRDRGLEWQLLYDRLYDRDFDISKESKLTCSHEFISPEKGLSDCLTSFIRNNKKFKAINFKNEAQKDKLTKEHLHLRLIPGLSNKVKYIIKRFFI